MFVFGMLTGAGLLALAQNFFNFRVDEVVIEYVYAPVTRFVGKVFGKKG